MRYRLLVVLTLSLCLCNTPAYAGKEKIVKMLVNLFKKKTPAPKTKLYKPVIPRSKPVDKPITGYSKVNPKDKLPSGTDLTNKALDKAILSPKEILMKAAEFAGDDFISESVKQYFSNNNVDSGNKLTINDHIQHANVAIQKGLLIYDNGRSPSALQHLVIVLENNPNNLEALNTLEKIAATYQDWASKNMDKRNYSEAKENLRISKVIIDEYNFNRRSRNQNKLENQLALGETKSPFSESNISANTSGYLSFINEASYLGKSKGNVSPNYCKQYATVAVAQQLRNEKYKCHLKEAEDTKSKNRWSMLTSPQYEWCLTAWVWVSKGEAVYRENKLNSCISKKN